MSRNPELVTPDDRLVGRQVEKNGAVYTIVSVDFPVGSSEDHQVTVTLLKPGGGYEKHKFSGGITDLDQLAHVIEGAGGFKLVKH